RPAGRRGGGSHGRDSARRIPPRLRGRQGGERRRPGHGIHRRAPFPALMTSERLLQLRPATPQDRFMIRRWLSNPAVQDWWGTAAGAEAQITLAMDSAAALPRIIQVGCTCIGYAHAVEAGQWAERLREGVPAGAWEVDYFLAPSKGDRAHDGSAVLTLLTAEVFTTTLAVACCSVISIRNEA